ncbi:MAG: universal stress protein [Chloroherpetonaceae bacterium]|nr:universal stress protein [Chloroherpetonaceae bacterium]
MLPQPSTISLKTILCPVDFSEQSKMIVTHAIKVSDIWRSEILALNTVDDNAPEYTLYRNSEKEIQTLRKTIEQDSQKRLQSQLSPLLSGIQSSLLTSFGKATDAIPKVCKEKNVGLMMMSTRSKAATGGQFILGSTTYKMIRTAPCPVMIFSRPEVKFSPSKILFPTDFSEISYQALPYVYRFAKYFDAEIHLVHFKPLTAQPTEKDPLTLLDMIRKQAGAAFGLRKVVVNEDLKGLTAGLAISKYSKDNSIDLVILSAHGASGYKQFFMGTTAVEVSSRCVCPVLVIRKSE